MEDLIKALQILLPYYYGGRWPTCCEHDIMYVCEVDVSKMDVSVVRELDKLGFMPGWGDEDYDTIKDALGEDFAGGHVIEFKFQGSASHVAYQYVHVMSLLF